MKIIEIVADSLGYLIMKTKDILLFVIHLIFDTVLRVYDKFLNSNFSEKVLFLNIIPAFFAIIMPVARFYLFETYFYINNPLAVYMIGIVIIIFITLYFSGLIVLVIRITVNAYYLFWVIYLPLAGELTKADPHQICFGYYLNIVIPVIYIIFSTSSYFISND